MLTWMRSVGVQSDVRRQNVHGNIFSLFFVISAAENDPMNSTQLVVKGYDFSFLPLKERIC